MTLDKANAIISSAHGDMTPLEEALWTVVADLRGKQAKVSRAAQIKSLVEDSGYTRKEAAALADAGFGEVA